MENKIQYKSLEIKEPTVNVEERTFEAFITATTLDLDNEVVLARGLDVSRFKQGKGKILYNHQKGFVLGVATEIKRVGERWKIKAKFASEQASERINEIYHLVKEGILTTMSIGFSVPRDGRRQPTAQDVKTYGKNVRSIITRAKLWEASVVVFESNEEAKILACKNLDIDPKFYLPEDYDMEEVIENVEEVEVKELDDVVIEEEVIEEVVEEVIEEVKELSKQDILIAKIKNELRIEYKKKEMVRIIKEELLKKEFVRKGKIYW